MTKRYRVTQRNQFGVFCAEKEYRFKLMAKLSAFFNKGQGSYVFGNGAYVYTTTLEKIR